MAEDELGAKAAATAEAVGAKQDAATHQPGSKPSSAGLRRWIAGHWHPIRGWMRSHWLLITFLLIVIGATWAGFHYKSLASPGTEPARFRSQAPQHLHVYFSAGNVTKARVVVYLGLDNGLNTQGYTYANDIVHIHVTYAHPVSQRKIIVISSTRPYVFGRSFIKAPPATRRFVRAVRLLREGGPNSRGEQTYYALLGFARIPIFFENRGSIYGHLPSVSFSQYPQEGTVVLAYFAPRTGKLLRAVTYDVSRGASCQPNGRPSPRIGKPHPTECVRFSELSGLSGRNLAAEYIRNVAATLNSDQIDYMNPSLSGVTGDYIWQSAACCDLEPTFKLTDPVATDSQSSAAFYSGIAFGVAGTALIAALQELREKRKRKGQSSPQDA